MTTVLLILIAILLFGLIVFVHEFGHFFTAKLAGIKVNEFAIGMGPKLIRFGKGETKYSLRLFPIGGFCAMEGEDEASEDARAFGNKPVWKRMIVVVAGAVMNMVLGFLLMMILLCQEPNFASTTVSKFTEDSATQAAGLEVGDRFYSIDGYRIFTDRDLSFALALADPHDVDLEVVRNGSVLSIPNVAFHTVEQDGTEILSLDFYVQPQAKTVWTLIQKTGAETVSVVRMVWTSLAGLVTGRFGLNDVAGPVGTAQAITQAASAGLQSGFGDAVNNILLMMIIITVNLGIVNLLPLPALDGGRLLFLIVEGIRRKPVNPKYEGWVHAAGFFLLMAFMLLITFNDIVRLVTGQGLGA
ncbi:M50 family metallopeptidase [Yeguia hominis]|uniref:Site-2 protease family protein n=1 Tax=Yeguia hominis TaxID=2763662 RepID=A0A926DBP7_9FIRM|nr:site-2 protease family protein [Yeguia hominis]MBC8534404.1 site-2 protease family protein [Yeguia hominis]